MREGEKEIKCVCVCVCDRERERKRKIIYASNTFLIMSQLIT